MTPTREEPETVYTYVDESGDELYQCVRYPGKNLRQRHRNGDGWVWNLEGIPRVLYHLPEVLDAGSNNRAVWFPEGEKDAENLRELGFVATTSPMGASSWRDEYANDLRGCAWVLIPCDADEPGRKFAHEKAASIHKRGIRCKVVDLAPDRSDGYDISDFILEHDSLAREDLEELARTTPAWPANRPLLAPVVSGVDFHASVGPYDKSREYLGPLFYGGERVHIIGQVNHGKTTFMLEALSAALHGEDFLGFQGRGDSLTGVYIDLEQPKHKFDQGIVDARLADPALKDRFSVWHEPEGLAIDQNSQHREYLLDLVQRFDIVCIDPWYKLIAEELSDGMRNVRPVISFLDGIRKRFPNTVVVLGRHTNEKEKGQKITLADASGYKAYERAADTTLGFQRLGGDRSRLIWLKTRSHLLPKIGESWLVEWKRGVGFQRVEKEKATDQVGRLLTDEWQTTYAIAEEWGHKSDYAAKVLNELVFLERAECRGSGHRGDPKMWRRFDANQEKLDVAA